MISHATRTFGQVQKVPPAAPEQRNQPIHGPDQRSVNEKSMRGGKERREKGMREGHT